MKKILDDWNKYLTESHSKEHEEQLEDIVKELEKASEMHANQSKQLEKASQMHASQAERIQKILDETDDDELEEGKKKNCGCGQDPCKTYGVQDEGVELDEKKKKKNRRFTN